MNCLTFRRRGCGPEGDRSEAGKSKHGGHDAREYPINETGHLDSSHLANAKRFGRSYHRKSSRTSGASRSGTRTKSAGLQCFAPEQKPKSAEHKTMKRECPVVVRAYICSYS